MTEHQQTFPIAERFISIQGEGLWAGTPMAFIRVVGCSVGKRVCLACDTDFDRVLPWSGGGDLSASFLRSWIADNRLKHVCLTGGEPLNQPTELFQGLIDGTNSYLLHIETSGTVPLPEGLLRAKLVGSVWISVSPKPGFLEKVVEEADEIKVIVPGLGNGTGWPTPSDARRWSQSKPVFLQPRNGKHDLDLSNLNLCKELVRKNPSLRLSVQMHKVLGER